MAVDPGAQVLDGGKNAYLGYFLLYSSWRQSTRWFMVVVRNKGQAGAAKMGTGGPHRHKEGQVLSRVSDCLWSAGGEWGHLRYWWRPCRAGIQ